MLKGFLGIYEIGYRHGRNSQWWTQTEMEAMLKRQRQQLMCVSRELCCSDAYKHVLLKSAGLSLSQILELHAMATLLHGRS